MKNKKIIHILISLILCILFMNMFLLKIHKKTYSYENFSREELQKMVASTALSYYYNHNYSDYEQKSMDSSGSISWRSLRYSPEMISRISNYMIDCSSFVSIVYLYSLGYDISDYRSALTSSYYFQGQKYNFSDSAESYQNGYYITGRSPSTSSYSKVAENYFKGNGQISIGNEYTNIDPKNEFVYYYRTDLKKPTNGSPNEETCNSSYYNESCDKQQEIRNNIINLLEPGDILVYRRRSKNDSNQYEYKGHAILYVGGYLKAGDKGFIHSTGSDFNFDSTPLTINEDTYSVRYNTWDFFETSIFMKPDSNEAVSYSFTVIRPLNTFCEDDACTFSIENVKSIRFKEDFDKNKSTTLARAELSRLREEQYQFSNEDSIYGYKDIVSKISSINVGDPLVYRLSLTNKSKIEFCSNSSPTYNTKTACTNKGYEWRTSTKNESYAIKIVNKIPEGTIFDSCERNCIYDEVENTVTWENVSVTPSNTASVVFNYKVRPTGTKTKIVNSGFEITTSNNNVLYMGEMTVNVNTTINSQYDLPLVSETINTIKDNSYSDDFDFVKDFYIKLYGIDLNYLTFDNIKNAIFKADAVTNNRFNKKIDIEINSSTVLEKNINKMLVPGVYGGRKLKNDDNLDRAHILIKQNYQKSLEVGDILITYSINDESEETHNVWLFAGYDSNYKMIFKRYENGSLVTYNSSSSVTGWRTFKEIFSYDLFIVLRPTMLYGTTIKYEFNNGTISNNVFVAYDKYKNLIVPEKSGYNVTFVIDGQEVETMSSSYTFDTWCSDQKLMNSISNGDNLLNTDNHSIYARYIVRKLKLPNYQKDGKDLVGWYSDQDLINKVGEPGELYEPLANMTLYPKYETTLTKVIKPTSENYCNKDLIFDGEPKALVKDARNGFTWLDNIDAINGGDYPITAHLKEGYKWDDDTFDDVVISCKIYKAMPEIKTGIDEIVITTNKTKTFNVSSNIRGKFTLQSEDESKIEVIEGNSEILEANVNNIITILSKENGQVRLNILFTPNDSTNYNIVEKVIEVNVLAKVGRVLGYDYNDETNYISNIDINTTESEYKKRIELLDGERIEVEFENINNKKMLYTGSKTKIYKGDEIIEEFTNIVTGDNNGDGEINSADLLRIKKHTINSAKMQGIYYMASDMNRDKSIDLVDLKTMKQFLATN